MCSCAMLLCARRQGGGLLLTARNRLIALALLPIVGHLQAGGTMPAASAAAHGALLAAASLTPVAASRPDAARFITLPRIPALLLMS
eukprot:COSAG06_NODE_621_length_13727_cov_26.487893_1_plen_87_part_00